MPKNRVERPIILGIVGDSAAGKTTLASGVAQILGKDQVVTICTDDYHKFDRAKRAENKTSALDPECNLSLIQHLRAHETREDLVCRLLLEKKKNPTIPLDTQKNMIKKACEYTPRRSDYQIADLFYPLLRQTHNIT